MSRMICIGGGNFRPPDDAHFSWIHSVSPTRKQSSPFIVLKAGEIRAIDNLHNLLCTGIKDSTEILQAWPGNYRTDVFRFTLQDLIEWRKKNAIST